MKYGDVNSDGVIDTTDIYLVRCHAENVTPLTGKALIVADVNLDGMVDYFDAKIIRSFLANNISKMSYTTNVVFGDTNLDGKVKQIDENVLKNVVENDLNLSFDAQLNADINMDDEINGEDLVLLQQYLNGEINSLPPNV